MSSTDNNQNIDTYINASMVFGGNPSDYYKYEEEELQYYIDVELYSTFATEAYFIDSSKASVWEKVEFSSLLGIGHGALNVTVCGRPKESYIYMYPINIKTYIKNIKRCTILMKTERLKKRKEQLETIVEYKIRLVKLKKDYEKNLKKTNITKVMIKEYIEYINIRLSNFDKKKIEDIKNFIYNSKKTYFDNINNDGDMIEHYKNMLKNNYEFDKKYLDESIRTNTIRSQLGEK
jgi:hypothetical protein